MESADPIRLFSGRRYISLESYDSDGEPRRTPVLSVESGGLLYLRTDPHTWKVKRIQSNPHVRVALCDRTGRPTGAWLEADAKVIEGQEQSKVTDVFDKEYGSLGNLLVTLVSRLRGEKLTTFISVKLRPS